MAFKEDPSDLGHPDPGIDKASLAALDPDGRLYNEDLAPASHDERKWNAYSLTALWMNDVHTLSVYAFAAAILATGLTGWQTIFSVLLGIIVVYLGCNLSGYIGKDTGVPFPVICRISWGLIGANVPALIRAIIAILWYGIQTYLAAAAVNELFRRFAPAMKGLEDTSFLGLDGLSWISFLILWAIQLAILSRGMNAVRHFQGWSGPAIWVVMIIVAIWLFVKADGDVSLSRRVVDLSPGDQFYQILVGASLLVASLGTLMLNFCDFSRFAPTRRAVRTGNFWGLPVNWTAFALTSVLISEGTLAVYGKPVLNPVELFGDMQSDLLVIVGALVVAIAALGVNIVANFVSPAYDLANVWPKKINFRRGGIITSILAVAVLPWQLYSSPTVIIYFAGGLGALLGPLFGVMMVDYFIIKKQQISVRDLYLPTEESAYFYWKGINPVAVAAFVPAAVVSLLIALLPSMSRPAPFSWFIGATVAAILYLVLGRRWLSPLGKSLAGTEQHG